MEWGRSLLLDYCLHQLPYSRIKVFLSAEKLLFEQNGNNFMKEWFLQFCCKIEKHNTLQEIAWAGKLSPERIARFLEALTFSRSYDSAPRPPPPPSLVSKLDRRHTRRQRMRDNFLTGEGGGEVGLGWSRSIWPQESLVLYKSLKTLWISPRAISCGVDSRHPFRGYSNEDAATKTRSSVATQTEKLQKDKPKQQENVYMSVFSRRYFGKSTFF